MQYPQTRYQDSLAVGISSSAGSLTITTTPPTRTEGIITVGRLTSNTEDMYFNGVAGSVVTLSLRGLSQTALTLTEVAGNKKTHLANESVEITTHHNYDTNKARKDEAETITGAWTFSGLITFSNTVTFTSKPKLTGLLDSGGNEAIDIDATSSAVNQLRVINAATGGNVILTTAGDDADIDLELQAKGTGVVIIEDGAVMKTSAAPTTDAMIANKLYVDNQVAAVSDSKVKASATDTTASTLDNKQTVGTHLSITVLNPAANEVRRIDTDAIQSTTGAGDTNKLIASDADGLLSANFTGILMNAIEAVDGSVTTLPVAIMGNNFKKLLLINTNGRTLFSNLTGTARNIGDADATTRLAQSFTITDSLAAAITLESMTMLLDKSGAPADNIYVEIQTDSGGSGPTGTVITNGTSAVIAGGSISTTMLPVQFTWSTPPTIVSGTKYWFVVRRSGANDAGNYYRGRDTSASTYASQEYMTYTASSGIWASGAGVDIQMMAQFNHDYNGKIAAADADNLVRAHFKGFTKSNVAGGSDAIVNVHGFQNGFTSLSAGSPYWLDTVQGQITATLPSLTTTLNGLVPRIRVGEALTDDTLEIKPTFEALLEISDVYSSGQPLVETGTAVATLNIFIETGFPPREFNIRFTISNVGGTAADDRYVILNQIGTTAVNQFYISATGLVLASASSLISASNPGYVGVTAIYENGFNLRIQAGNATEDLSSLSVLAKS